MTDMDAQWGSLMKVSYKAYEELLSAECEEEKAVQRHKDALEYIKILNAKIKDAIDRSHKVEKQLEKAANKLDVARRRYIEIDLSMRQLAQEQVWVQQAYALLDPKDELQALPNLLREVSYTEELKAGD